MSRQLTKVLQQESSDCGVACLAMLANVSYDEARRAFTEVGLHTSRGKRQPFSSNFTELRQAAAVLGVRLKMSRFSDWALIKTRAIVKVLVTPDRNWHWVVAVRGDDGIIIYDPAVSLLSYEQLPENELAIDFAFYTPQGNVLLWDTDV